MAQCNKQHPDGTICRQNLFECPDCGNVGCYPGAGCSFALLNAQGECKVCGGVALPKKFIAYANINENYPTHHHQPA